MKFRILLLVALLPISVNQACHTPKRSKALDKKYPAWNLVDLMHSAHNQEYKGYNFKSQSPCINGKSDIYPCQNIDLMGHLDLPNIGGGQGSDSWGWKHEESNRYFALVGRTHGTSFVEITNPASPVYLGQLPSTRISSAWRDIKTYKNHAYIVADAISGHGMQVFDLTNLLDVQNAPQTFSALTTYKQNDLGPAHNIFINEDSGFAYLLGSNTCAGGLHMVNINQPASPQFAGCFSDDGYSHDAQCVVYKGPDQKYQNKEICFASNEDTITVVDVSDKSNPEQLSRIGYAESQYTHQGWLSKDQKYLVIDDELDERQNNLNTRTHVIDFASLENPVSKGFYEADGKGIDHNQYVVGDHTFQANYTRGLRVLKLGDLDNAKMSEVAYFDTHPETDSSLSFDGAWNVYPFFDNNIVLISDISRGVFILKVNLEEEQNDDVIFKNGFEATQ